MAKNFAFLHGGGQGGWVWAELIAALQRQAPDAKTIALDAPGCGAKRDRDTSAISQAEIAEELVADVRAAGLTEVILVGHSNAGTTMPGMLRLGPDLFHRAVYVTCCAPAPGQTVLQMMGTALHGENPDEVGWPVSRAAPPAERYDRMFCNDMDADQKAALLARLGPDHWPAANMAHSDWQYGDVPAPSTYVLCLKDGSLPLPWQERFASRHGVERRVYLDAGHQAMNTRPEGLAEILLAEARL